MEDNIYTLKSDIQQCIANNIKTLQTNYRLFLFEGDTMEYTQTLGCFENLEIKPNESLMQFTGNIAKDLKFSNGEMLKIRQNVWKKNMYELSRQIKESKKTPMQKENERIIAESEIVKLLDDLEDKEEKYRPAKKYEKFLLKSIQLRLKEIGLNLDYEEHEEMLMLSGNFEYLKFSKDDLRLIVHLLEDLDMFLIAPFYEEQDDENEIILNEEEDKCKSIRIVMGLYLSEEE